MVLQHRFDDGFSNVHCGLYTSPSYAGEEFLANNITTCSQTVRTRAFLKFITLQMNINKKNLAHKVTC